MTGSTGGEGVTTHTPLPKKIIPVRITLLSLDKQNYKWGDRAIYEVTLKNITNHNLVIPWSADYDGVKPDEDHDPPGYVWALLNLTVEGEAAGDEFVAGRSIYGSQLLRGSLKNLRPGQKVTIRAAGPWSFLDQDVNARILAKLPRTFQVRAHYVLYDRPPSTSYQPALSANSKPVELRKRQ